MKSRTGKQIRERFLNKHDEKLKKEKFEENEDNLIIKWQKVYGNSWTKIAKKIEGRTGDMIKNRYNSILNKKLKKKYYLLFLNQILMKI